MSSSVASPGSSLGQESVCPRPRGLRRDRPSEARPPPQPIQDPDDEKSALRFPKNACIVARWGKVEAPMGGHSKSQDGSARVVTKKVASAEAG
jgi:hypothetical protein